MAIELFDHNREAYESAVAMLAETGKACVIHPTGTGKSFIGFKFCEDNPNKKVLWLAHQLENNGKKLSKERRDREKLVDVGVTFEKEPWEERFRFAKAYYEEHGLLNMPAGYKVEGIWLHKWLNEQKQVILGKRKGKALTAEQIKKLESIGFSVKVRTPKLGSTDKFTAIGAVD